MVAGETVVFDDFPPSVDLIHASLFTIHVSYDAIIELLCVLS